MDFSNIDPAVVAALAFAVAGIVELVKSAFDQNFRTTAIIAIAGIAGAVFAPFAGDISWFTGLLIGFSASGLITTVSALRS